MALARKLVKTAAEAGADYIKFQTFKADMLVTKSAEKAQYQKNNTFESETQFEMIKRLELSDQDHKDLIQYSEKNDIQFLSTPFDFHSIEFLLELDIPFFKIPSGEITNFPYLRQIGRLGRKVIMSTGMSTIEEVRRAMEILTDHGTKKENITLLQCNTEYPTPLSDVNLKAMLVLRDELGVKVGYSDHTLGIEVAIAAVAMGAEVIEKHFTIDKNLPGPDHSSSLEPDELKEMVCSIRNIEESMGDGIKRPSSSEIKNIEVARKSIVASTTIKKGDYFTEENITVKRPGNGMSPMRWDTLIGTMSDCDYEKNDQIQDIK